MLSSTAFNTILGALVVPTFAVGLLSFAYLIILLSARLSEPRRNERKKVARTFPATIVLCVRGADEQLKRCLKGLFEQDHDDYHIFVVVDNEEDSAWPVVHALASEHQFENITIQPLRERLSTCSLKCSALIQALDGIDEQREICAFIDSDVIPHETWLQDLIVDFDDPKVGLTFGTRWFVAPKFSLGGVVRHTFGYFGAVGSEFLKTPWGGSLAVRLKCLKQPEVLDQLAHALVEDAIYFDVLDRQGMKIKIARDIVMPNVSECEFPAIYYWCRRQYVGSRLYYPHWSRANLLSAGIALSVLGQVVLFVQAVIAGNLEQAKLLLAVAAVEFAFCWTVFAAVDGLLTTAVRKHDRSIAGAPNLIVRSFLTVLVGIFLMQILAAHVYAVREVTWRGIRYRIDGPWKVTRLNYDLDHA